MLLKRAPLSLLFLVGSNASLEWPTTGSTQWRLMHCSMMSMPKQWYLEKWDFGTEMHKPFAKNALQTSHKVLKQPASDISLPEAEARRTLDCWAKMLAGLFDLCPGRVAVPIPQCPSPVQSQVSGVDTAICKGSSSNSVFEQTIQSVWVNNEFNGARSCLVAHKHNSFLLPSFTSQLSQLSLLNIVWCSPNLGALMPLWLQDHRASEEATSRRSTSSTTLRPKEHIELRRTPLSIVLTARTLCPANGNALALTGGLGMCVMYFCMVW